MNFRVSPFWCFGCQGQLIPNELVVRVPSNDGSAMETFHLACFSCKSCGAHIKYNEPFARSSLTGGLLCPTDFQREFLLWNYPSGPIAFARSTGEETSRASSKNPQKTDLSSTTTAGENKTNIATVSNKLSKFAIGTINSRQPTAEKEALNCPNDCANMNLTSQASNSTFSIVKTKSPIEPNRRDFTTLGNPNPNAANKNGATAARPSALLPVDASLTTTKPSGRQPRSKQLSLIDGSLYDPTRNPKMASRKPEVEGEKDAMRMPAGGRRPLNSDLLVPKPIGRPEVSAEPAAAMEDFHARMNLASSQDEQSVLDLSRKLIHHPCNPVYLKGKPPQSLPNVPSFYCAESPTALKQLTPTGTELNDTRSERMNPIIEPPHCGRVPQIELSRMGIVSGFCTDDPVHYSPTAQHQTVQNENESSKIARPREKTSRRKIANPTKEVCNQEDHPPTAAAAAEQATSLRPRAIKIAASGYPINSTDFMPAQIQQDPTSDKVVAEQSEDPSLTMEQHKQPPKLADSCPAHKQKDRCNESRERTNSKQPTPQNQSPHSDPYSTPDILIPAVTTFEPTDGPKPSTETKRPAGDFAAHASGASGASRVVDGKMALQSTIAVPPAKIKPLVNRQNANNAVNTSSKQRAIENLEDAPTGSKQRNRPTDQMDKSVGVLCDAASGRRPLTKRGAKDCPIQTNQEADWQKENKKSNKETLGEKTSQLHRRRRSPPSTVFDRKKQPLMEPTEGTNHPSARTSQLEASSASYPIHSNPVEHAQAFLNPSDVPRHPKSEEPSITVEHYKRTCELKVLKSESLKRRQQVDLDCSYPTSDEKVDGVHERTSKNPISDRPIIRRRKLGILNQSSSQIDGLKPPTQPTTNVADPTIDTTGSPVGNSNGDLNTFKKMAQIGGNPVALKEGQPLVNQRFTSDRKPTSLKQPAINYLGQPPTCSEHRDRPIEQRNPNIGARRRFEIGRRPQVEGLSTASTIPDSQYIQKDKPISMHTQYKETDSSKPSKRLRMGNCGPASTSYKRQEQLMQLTERANRSSPKLGSPSRSHHTKIHSEDFAHNQSSKNQISDLPILNQKCIPNAKTSLPRVQPMKGVNARKSKSESSHRPRQVGPKPASKQEAPPKKSRARDASAHSETRRFLFHNVSYPADSKECAQMDCVRRQPPQTRKSGEPAVEPRRLPNEDRVLKASREVHDKPNESTSGSS